MKVANRTLNSSKKVCEDFGIAQAEDDPYAIIEDPEVDAIVIGTWPNKHHEFTCAALKNGKHVLVEARMAMNANQAKEMLAISHENRELTAQVVPAPMALGYDAEIIRMMGRIGKLVHVDLRVSGGAFPDYTSPPTWRQNRALSGHNIMGVGIFYETLMRWVGPAARLVARGRFVVDRWKEHDPGYKADMQIPDHVLIMGDLDRDRASFAMSFSEVCGQRREMVCWIHGDRGSVMVDFASGQIYYGERESDQVHPVARDRVNESGWRVEQEFVNSIRGTEEVKLTSFEKGVAYMLFTDAVWESMDTNQVAEVQS